MKTYHVDGMSCGHCAQAVTDALKSIKDSAVIHVDLDKKSVSVDGIEDLGMIEEVIEDAGFDFKGEV